jgi:hypothetical protein
MNRTRYSKNRVVLAAPRKHRLATFSLVLEESLSSILRWTGGVLLLSPSRPLTSLMKFMYSSANTLGT